MKKRILSALIMAVCLLACSSTDDGASTSAPVNAGGDAFGQSCTQAGDPGDCPATYVCHDFPRKGGLRCTRNCTTATQETDCPQTKKCGGNNLCSVP
ncbi:hypothetical protein LZC95_17760 [Pendulispora brunnea]|uniref:Lipoprotein n=1 Tax=Pendulispora brunnea TaxID=2905690 RepID=A0ABZ2KM27_9BACT